MDQWKYRLRRIIEWKQNNAKDYIEALNCYNCTDDLGCTLLHYSAQYGNEDVTQYLLGKGCNINAQDKSGQTPLMMAVRGNHEPVTRMLLTAGADIYIRNRENQSALHIIFARHYVSKDTLSLFVTIVKQQFLTIEDTAQYLIDAGCQLYHAVFLNDIVIIEYMLLRGFNVNSRRPIDGKTALHLAVINGDLNSVNLLLENGANARALDYNEATPLYYLYINGTEPTREKLAILEILSNLGVSLEECTRNHFPQVGHVLKSGNPEAIHILLRSNFNFASKDKEGRNVLHYLAQNTTPGLLDELHCHASKFNMTAVDKTGGSPLFRALIVGNVQMVQFLLEAGFDPNYSSQNQGTLPLLFFSYMKSEKGLEHQYEQCFELLLQYNANPQYFIQSYNDEEKLITVFDFGFWEDTSLNKIKAVVAQVAILKGLGTPITKLTREKIKASSKLKRYFKRCQQILKRKIANSVTVLELLTDPKLRMMKYVGDAFIQILACFIVKNKLKCNYSYYYNIIDKHLQRVKEYKEAAIAIRKLFHDRIGEEHRITCAILNYSDDPSLRALSQYFQLYR